MGTGIRATLAPDGSGGYLVRWRGEPGVSYHLERAANVRGPWSALGTAPAPPAGLVVFPDTSPLAGRGFYRVTRP